MKMLNGVLVILSCLLCSCCAAIQYNLTVVSLPTVTETNTRIIGGSATTIERFPYTVQVQHNGRLTCGGTLVTRRHVLTAAHCFFDSNNNLLGPNLYSIRAGTANLGSGGSVHSVSMVIIHERYNTPIRDNDIAVMVLSSTVAVSVSVGTARIPAQWDVVPDNLAVTHVGWGRTNANVDQAASILQQVEIRTINRPVCAQRYELLASIRGEPFPVTDNMICSGLLDIGGADACQGDSGGPLVYNGIVVGVTSWGYGCALAQFPGVNARVASYTNWINNTVVRYNAGPPASSASAVLLALCAISSWIFAHR